MTQRPTQAPIRHPCACARATMAPRSPATKEIVALDALPCTMADVDTDVIDNTDAPWNRFSSHDYWRRNYQELHAEDQEIISRVSHFFDICVRGPPARPVGYRCRLGDESLSRLADAPVGRADPAGRLRRDQCRLASRSNRRRRRPVGMAPLLAGAARGEGLQRRRRAAQATARGLRERAGVRGD